METQELLKTAAERIEQKNAIIKQSQDKIASLQEENEKLRLQVNKTSREKIATEIVTIMSTKQAMTPEQASMKIAEYTNSNDDLNAIKKWASELGNVVNHGQIVEDRNSFTPVTAADKFKHTFIAAANKLS